MDVIQLIGNSPILESNALSHKLINYLLDIIAYVLPDLYRFTQTDWVIYISDIKPDILMVLVQTLIYVIFLSCAALFDLYRKEL